MEDIVLDNKLQLRGQFRKSGIIYGDVLAAIYEKNKIKKKNSFHDSRKNLNQTSQELKKWHILDEKEVKIDTSS